MAKKIVINSCDECPRMDHSGRFTPGGAYPICRHSEVLRTKGNHWKHRILPYYMSNRAYTGDIPEWCPLDEN